MMCSIWELVSIFLSRHTLWVGASLWLSGYRICLRCKRNKFDPWVGKIPWRRKWQSTPVFLPGKPHGQRKLVCYYLWVPKSQTQLSDELTTAAIWVGKNFYLCVFLWFWNIMLHIYENSSFIHENFTF